MLDLDGCLLEIMANGAPAAEKGRFPHLAFQVEDVEFVKEYFPGVEK